MGVHLSLSINAAKQLFACRDDGELRRFVEEFTANDDNRRNGLVHETGDVWMTLHRCLTDGTLDPSGGEFPLNHCFLGGRRLHQEMGFTVALVRPDMTKHVADAISQVDAGSLRAQYDQLTKQQLGHAHDDGEFERAMSALRDLGAFLAAAKEQRHAVIFAAETLPSS